MPVTAKCIRRKTAPKNKPKSASTAGKIALALIPTPKRSQELNRFDDEAGHLSEKGRQPQRQPSFVTGYNRPSSPSGTKIVRKDSSVLIGRVIRESADARARVQDCRFRTLHGGDI